MWILSTLTLFVNTAALCQQTARPLTKRIMVKTNLLNLLAQKPTVSVEKVLGKNISAEVSYVQGAINNTLYTDHYDYKGWMLKVKKYLTDLRPGIGIPSVSAYTGNLDRTIQRKRWFGYPYRNFSSNSIRGGLSAGIIYFTRSRFVFEEQNGLGYGRYLNLDRPNANTYHTGYLDVHVWLSVGYCF